MVSVQILLCCSSAFPHHQTRSCDSCKHKSEVVDQADAGTASGRQLITCRINYLIPDFFKQGRKIADGIRTMTSRILKELEEMYPGLRYDPNDPIYSMDRFYRESGVQFVILIDEWDAVFRIQKKKEPDRRSILIF